MPVIPNDPAIPLWVLNSIPSSRNRTGYTSDIWLNVAQAVFLLTASALRIQSGLKEDHFVWGFLLFLLGLVSLYIAIRAFLARRWIDRHQQWATVKLLKWDKDELFSKWILIGIFALIVVWLVCGIVLRN